MKLKILKSFSLALALSTWIRHLAMALVDLISLSENVPLFKNGGMLTEMPCGKMSGTKKPLSVRIHSPAVKCLSRPDCWTMALSEMDPKYNLLT